MVITYTPHMYATTQQLIHDVILAVKLGYVPINDESRLIHELRTGAIVHPTWEDYDLNTLDNGRPSVKGYYVLADYKHIRFEDKKK